MKNNQNHQKSPLDKLMDKLTMEQGVLFRYVGSFFKKT